MNITIKRKHYSRWSVDGDCYINGKKVCDTIEHPTKHRACGEYALTRDDYKQFFMRGNGPMKSIRGEVSLGILAMTGVVHEAAQMHTKVLQRIGKALKRNEIVTLTITNKTYE